MILTLLLVAAGGALGSVLRYWLSTIVQRRSHTAFPMGTLVVNLTGCLIISGVYAAFDNDGIGSTALTVLVAGLLGGYTTFSTFSVENLSLLREQRLGWLVGNLLVQIVGGLAVLAAGYALVGYLLGRVW